MIPTNITKEHVIKAIQDIESLKVTVPQHRQSEYYDVIYQEKRYPPKFVISQANTYANGSELRSNEFDSIEAKAFLPRLGFEIKLKFDIKPGDVISNQQLSTLFGCGTQGGMRKSNKTNSLVIISDQTKPFYKDEWKGEVLHYTGMGISGDQDINYLQNKTLAESGTNGVDLHLFEVDSPGKYSYKGMVELAGEPYRKPQKDKDGNERNVVIFPLKQINPELPNEEFEHVSKQKNPAKRYPKKQVILYGPPGTGKTFSTIIRAHEIIFGAPDPSITFQTLQEKLRTQSKQGVDPTQISSWLKAIMLAFHEIHKEKVQVNEIRNSKIIEEYSQLTNNHTVRNTIWYTLQAESRLDSEIVKQKRKTGNEYFDKDSESNWYLTEKGKIYLNSLIEDLQDSPATSISQFNFVTFHQSYSYEDFIEGIKPDTDESEESQIIYTIKDGIFKEICKKATLDPDNNYVLIIDEINRGNISKIFGELITLLEDNKRSGEKEAITVRLPYSKKDFSVPNNVYIIGTMNSTDKSIALVDVALRRRFHFERLNVNYDLIQNADAKNFLKDLNGIICALKNPDFEIGHSYFMDIPKTDEGNEELKKVFTSKILPLIEEYFFNDWEALATILGTDSILVEKRKKLVWDEDSGEFKKESEEFDRISGRCIDYSKDIFENTRMNLKKQQKTQDITKNT